MQTMSESQRSTTTSLAIVVYMLLTLVSAMLLFGVLKNKPTYILPFFGIQFIDFLFTLPQFLTSLYNQPNHPHYNVLNERRSTFLDMRHIWPNASPNNVYTSSLLFTTLIVLFKSYFLCVVWKCYRYLRMKELVLPLHLPHFSHNIANDVSIDCFITIFHTSLTTIVTLYGRQKLTHLYQLFIGFQMINDFLCQSLALYLSDKKSSFCFWRQLYHFS